MKRAVLPFITCIVIVSSSLAQSANNRDAFREPRIIPLPFDVVVDQYSTPVISSAGDVAFISSVMTGSLISFSLSSGRMISSVSFGKVAGIITMVEPEKRRLIALPTANDPDNGLPATVNIIDAAEAERPQRVARVELPLTAHLTPTTRALLTADGRFGVIASSFHKPELFSFSVETGKITSKVSLSGWPSEMAMYDGKKVNADSTVAVVSAESNTLCIVTLDQFGRLSGGRTFSHTGVRLDVSNNPGFSCDGQIVYLAFSDGEYLFSIDAQTAKALGVVKLISSPHRITVTRDHTGSDLIAVTRIGQSGGKPGGVTLLTYDKGHFAIKAEFTPPDSIQFSRVSNVVFNADASLALIGSKSGFLFAFNTKSGELESHRALGNEVRGFALNSSTHTLVAVRSTAKSDEIAVVGFDPTYRKTPAPPVISKTVPEIRKVSTDVSQLRIVIEGTNFNKVTTLEFVKSGDVVLRKSPVVVSDKQLILTLPAKTLEALGKFDLRVSTPDKATSNAVAMEPAPGYTGGPLVATVLKTTSPALPVRVELQEPQNVPTVAKTKAAPLPRVASAVQSVRTLEADGGLRVFVETDGEVKFQDFTLTDPSRIVIDILGVENKFGNKVILVDSGKIDRVRVGQPKPGVVRVVLDTNVNVGYSLTREGRSLVIDVGRQAPRASPTLLY
jgi:outer membrane protein assembly factor BamB